MDQTSITTSSTTLSTTTSNIITTSNILNQNTTQTEDTSSSLLISSGGGTGTGNIPVITSSGTSLLSNIGCSSGLSILSSNTSGGGGHLSDSQKSISIIQSATPSPVLSPPGKIFGRNANCTMVATSTPNNEAELQLYRVLQRASLLAYYDTLLEMGGDDVQQLCDAGEEEFLEIMALVGMASKPLHVRRLQKSLHEWATNPSIFQNPLSGMPEINPLIYNTPEPSTSRRKFTISPSFNPTPLINTAASSVVTPLNTNSNTSFTSLTCSGLTSQVTSSSPQLTPVLTDIQISKISQLAEKMTRQIPQKEPRQSNSKKRASKELEQVMTMSENDPRRMDEIRKYAAIYGRFDCKRRPEKPLTLHEVCVNEAAAQICKFIPALLTRRDELFPLARQLVKDAGFGHSASIARFLEQQQQKLDDNDGTSNAKRVRLSSTETLNTECNKEYLEENRLNLFTMYQKLSKQPFDLSDISKFSLLRSDYEDENDNDDSRLSFSTSSSPPLQFGLESDMMNRETIENGKNDMLIKSPNINQDNNRIRMDIPTSPIIISAAGSHIIAVANPALALSPTLNECINIKRENASPEA